MWVLAEWALYLVLWMAYVGKASLAELAVGVVATSLGLWAAWSTRKEERWHYRHLTLIAQAWHLVRYIFEGTGEVLAVLARHLFTGRKAESLVLAVPFVAIGDDDESELRRALATVLTTIAPNFVVIDVDRDTGLLLFHQIKRSPVPQMTQNLGARP